jgi:hypothetical protein
LVSSSSSSSSQSQSVSSSSPLLNCMPTLHSEIIVTGILKKEQRRIFLLATKTSEVVTPTRLHGINKRISKMLFVTIFLSRASMMMTKKKMMMIATMTLYLFLLKVDLVMEKLNRKNL